MLQTVIKKGSYQDSVVLMLLTNRISAMEGVRKVSIMMATPANKDIMAASGLATDKLADAGANDMALVADVDREEQVEEILKEVDQFLTNQASKTRGGGEKKAAKNWEQALAAIPDANLAVISIPGTYAAAEADRALDEGLHVFMFSDNVRLEDEIRLKRKAHEKGLLVMGPDCGTGIIQGVPIAFTNHVARGKIGIVGASGTGIQELTTIIDRLGEGVTNAIGTGGRDLNCAVGGVTMMDAIDAMEADPETEIVIVISKPPAKEVRDTIVDRLADYEKPVVTLFLGEKPEIHTEGFYHASTLDDAARIAVRLSRGEPVETTPFTPQAPDPFAATDGKTIKAYYSGGTLAGEAAMMMRDAMGIPGEAAKKEGFMLNQDGNLVIDLGDDVYTQGKPHPMIDPAKRIACMEEAARDASTGVILFDIVMGYGSHENMAAALLPAVEGLKEEAEKQGRKLHFVTTVCGTKADPQGYDGQVRLMEEAGVLVADSNKRAVETALALIGYRYEDSVKEILPAAERSGKTNAAPTQVQELLSSKPRVINIGLRSFYEVLEKFDCPATQFDWTPPAGGDLELIRALRFLRRGKTPSGIEIDQANAAVAAKIVSANPVLLDVVPAASVIGELSEGKTLLHAGPPILWENMTDPMQGSCVGAVLFEGWADTEEAARRMLSGGEIRFIPCHHVDAVGPMGGITSAQMPVFVVENTTEGNRAFCSMNEGIGKVLRFGAYSEDVVARLGWMRDVLGPTLSRAVKSLENGLALAPIMAKAIAMGDEFHQRNIAASLVLLKELSPIIVGLDMDETARRQVIRFLSDTDQFFLNIMMAAAKAIMDGARTVADGTLVTAMCRNGENFGIRISGMGDAWFTAPVNTPQGLYFTGYDGEDASPDMGDSAITETFGTGGMAMIAAPAVTRFVGAGGYEDARDTSEEMMEICIGRNPNFTIPTWSFKGICLGIDARKVVEKEITPVINTGIAHKVAGYGQIGAGTVHPPLACFQKAILAYAEKLGFSRDKE
jgi:succinyl-CoA synthetase alpha subunit